MKRKARKGSQRAPRVRENLNEGRKSRKSKSSGPCIAPDVAVCEPTFARERGQFPLTVNVLARFFIPSTGSYDVASNFCNADWSAFCHPMQTRDVLNFVWRDTNFHGDHFHSEGRRRAARWSSWVVANLASANTCNVGVLLANVESQAAFCDLDASFFIQVNT